MTKTSHIKHVRVTIVAGEYPPMISGVGDYSYHLGHALAALGSETRVITTRMPNVRLCPSSSENTVSRPMDHWQFSEFSRISEHLRLYKEPFVLNLQYYCPQAYGRRLMINFLPAAVRMCFPHCRVITTIHGFWEQSSLYKLRTLPMLRFSHGVIYVDRQNEIPLKRYCGPHVSTKFIPITGNIPPVHCDSEQRRIWRSNMLPPVADGDIAVAFFGGIARVKGVEYLIEAIELVRARTNLPVRLVFVGGFHADNVNTSYQAEIRAMIEQPERAKWIAVVQSPEAERVSQLLHASDLAVFPFTNGVGENSGSTLAALQHGLPTIVTSGLTALPSDFPVACVPARDSQALATRISSLCTSTIERQALRRASLDFMSRLTWHTIAEQTISYFESTCDPIRSSSLPTAGFHEH